MPEVQVTHFADPGNVYGPIERFVPSSVHSER